MIFNCDNCAKSISSKMSYCPFCKCETAEFSLLLEKKKKEGIKSLPAVLLKKLKGTIAMVR